MLGIKRIDKLVLSSYIGPYLMSLTIILFLLVMQFMSLYMHEIFGKGLDPTIMLKLFYYASGRLLLIAMPIGVLAGALITFGNLGEYYELASMKSCGISLFKIMRSVVIFIAIITGLSLWFSFDVIPKANLKFFSLLYDIQRKKADVAIKPGHFYRDIDGYVIRVSDKNLDTGTLYDVTIYNHEQNRGNNDIFMADSARMKLRGNVMSMTLYEGIRYEDYKPESGKPENMPHGRTYFDSLIYRFTLEGFDLSRTDESQFRHQITLTRRQLSSALDSLDDLQSKYIIKSLRQVGRYTKVDTNFLEYAVDTLPRRKALEVVALEEEDDIITCYEDDVQDVLNRALVNARAVKSYVEFMIKKTDDQAESDRKYSYEYYLRFALPFNCLVFIFIGVSLGAIIRKGGFGPPALVSIILFLVFYILTTYGKKFAKEGVLDPWVGAWLSVIVFTPLAIYFTYQATTDARLFDESTWQMIREWVGNLFNRKKAKNPHDRSS